MSYGRKIVSGGGQASGVRVGTVIADNLGFGHLYRPKLLYIVQDTFTDADGTRLDQHQPEASPGNVAWTPTAVTGAPTPATLTIQGNQAVLGTDINGVAMDSGLANVDIGMDVTYSAVTRWGIILRQASSTNMLAFRIRAADSLMELISITAGAITTIGSSVAITVTTGQTYKYRVRADGQRITIWQDGVQIFDATGVTAYQNDTQQGFISFNSDQVERYDNFTVRPINSSTPIPT